MIYALNRIYLQQWVIDAYLIAWRPLFILLTYFSLIIKFFHSALLSFASFVALRYLSLGNVQVILLQTVFTGLQDEIKQKEILKNILNIDFLNKMQLF